jgi:hypothetical protein
MQMATPEPNLAEARRRIAACRESRSHSLDLGNLQLAELPDELLVSHA